MRVVYTVSANHQMKFKSDLDEIDFPYKYEENLLGRFIHFNIADDHPQWPIIEKFIEKYDVFTIQKTEFTAKELKSAKYLELGCNRHQGYPKPDSDFGYSKITYESFCEKCGIGKQKAPFRMSSEPKWGKKHMFRLHWVYDEYFTLPEVWQNVFRPFGIGCRPAVQHRSGKELKTVVQLDIKDTSTSALIINDLPYEICPECKRGRYFNVIKGYFPGFSTPQKSDLFKTKEYFGSGASSSKAVIVSAKLYQVIKNNKLKGLTFTPVANETSVPCNS